MADNVTLSTGEVVRTLEDGSSVHHPVSIQVFATSVGSPDVISIPTAAALADNTSNPTTVLYGTCLLAYDGSTWDRVRGDSTDGLLVNLGSNNDVVCTNSGTFAVQAAQSGTWNITNVSGTVSLPTGASTAAKQPALGTAGTASADVITVQGIASMTAIKVDGSAVTQPVNGSVVVTNAGTFAVQAAQAGTWTIADISGTISLPTGAATSAKQDTGNTSLASIDGKITAVNTGAVVVSSSALPTGAATEARQPSLGTAGTPSGNVITVQGIAGMTAFAVTQSGTWDEVGINDSGNSITVDAPVGTPVFVRLSDGGSAIATLPVSLASVPSHAVTNAGTFAVQVDGSALTSLQLIDDAIFAEDVASQAADKGIQILTVRKDTAAATSGTDGDYQPPVSNARGATWVAIEDGAGGQITSFGGGTEYTEDAAAAANPVGKAMILVRADALAGVTTTDGDNVAARGTDKGEVYVKHADSVAVTNASLTTIAGAVSGTEMQCDVLTMPTVTVNAHAVTNAGTFAVQVDGAALTSLQLIDDAAVVLGTATYTEATSTGLAIGAVRRDADTTLVNTTNEWGPLQMDANGRLKVEAFSGEALPVTFTGSTDVATQTTLASALTSLQTIDNCISGTGVNVSQLNGVAVTMGNGASGTGVQRVTIANDSTGTLGTVSNVTTVATVTALTGSGLAHDEVDSGNPHKIGMRAIAHGTNPTAVAAADRTHLYANRAGIPFVIGGHPNIVTRTATVLDSDGAQTNVSLLSVSAGTKIVVTRVSIMADGSNTGPVNMKVGFGTATLAAASTTGTAGILADFLGVPPGGGAVIGDGSGIIGVGADDEDVRYTAEDPAGGAITVSISYFTIES